MVILPHPDDGASISRPRFLRRLLRTPAGIAVAVLLACAVAYLLWQWRSHISDAALIAALACILVFLHGLLPMTVGFLSQFFVRKPLPAVATLLLAGCVLAATVSSGWFDLTFYSRGEDGAATVHALPPFVSWTAGAIGLLIYCSFVSTGAAACRRAFRKRFAERPPGAGGAPELAPSSHSR